MLFRQGLKEKLVRRSNYYGIIGALALALSMTAATMLVVDFLFESALAWATAGGLALLVAWAWFGQPAFNRFGRSDEAPTAEQEEGRRGGADPAA
jgi:membrane protein implicated in regulation of membrane protease activity